MLPLTSTVGCMSALTIGPMEMRWISLAGLSPATSLFTVAEARWSARIHRQAFERDRPEIRGIMTIGVGPVGYVAGWGGHKTWLEDAASFSVDAVKTFAAGLRQNDAAVRAALTMPWSSRQAEGQINKLKLLKRQTYGRASLDLLRRRMLLAA